nr:hypothetical protein [Nanoarchaeum sp.]
MLVDVHCHLDLLEKQKNLDEAMKNAKDFYCIISNSTDPKSNRKNLEYPKKYKNVKVALGMYPEHAVELSNKEIDDEISFIKKNKPFAIGEVGLDNFRVVNMKKQKEVFSKFIKLSNDLNIPVIVHSRKAELETLECLEENNAKKVVMHCFSGNKELVERGVKNGYYFTIPTSVVKNKTFRKLVVRVPLNRILTETDAPYLSPIENEANEPAFIKESMKKIAEIKKITVEEMEKIIYMNFQNLFLKA